MQNKISVSIDNEVLQQILQKVADIKGQLPFLVKLTDAERKSLQMMDDGRKPFVEKSFDYAARNEAVNPGGDLMEAAAVDLSLNTSLQSVENELAQLYESVRDTRMLAGAEAYEVARFIYMKAKMAEKMGVPGMKTVVDDLAKLFKQGPGNNTQQTD